MAETISVKVSNRSQIALPSLARKQLNIQAGDRLLVDIKDGMIVLLPQPENYADYLAGLHRDIWQVEGVEVVVQDDQVIGKTGDGRLLVTKDSARRHLQLRCVLPARCLVVRGRWRL